MFRVSGALTGSNKLAVVVVQLRASGGAPVKIKALFVMVFLDSLMRDGRCENASLKTD